MVVDTSAILAVYFDEPMASWVASRLREHRRELKMSTANYCEALILVLDRRPHRFDDFRQFIHEAGIHMMPPTGAHAELAARARRRFPLNLGDCFAYALAKDEDLPILTLDTDFRKSDLRVVSPEGHSKQ